MLQVGLNPYGMCCTFGLIGQGTDRGAPEPLGLEDFIELGAQVGARCLEIDFRFLASLSKEELTVIAGRLRDAGMVPILSTGAPTDRLAQVLEAAVAIGCKLIRMALTTVLCGNRSSTPNWNDMLDTSIRGLNKWAPLAAEFGVGFAIENHQDLGSEELLRYAEAAGRNVGICFDTGNPLAVGEDIVAFAKRVSGRVSHVHLKDYRVQFTDEGYRLVRCPIADGCAPFKVIEGILLSHHDHLTASLEPGALEARHVRLFTDEWWNGYPPRSARELGAAMRTARRNRLAEDEEYRTPWELHATGDEIVRYEKDVLKRSVDNMKQLGWL